MHAHSGRPYRHAQPAAACGPRDIGCSAGALLRPDLTQQCSLPDILSFTLTGRGLESNLGWLRSDSGTTYRVALKWRIAMRCRSLPLSKSRGWRACWTASAGCCRRSCRARSSGRECSKYEGKVQRALRPQLDAGTLVTQFQTGLLQQVLCAPAPELLFSLSRHERT